MGYLCWDYFMQSCSVYKMFNLSSAIYVETSVEAGEEEREK